MLRARLVDALVVRGAKPNVCALATVLGAIDRGYRVILVPGTRYRGRTLSSIHGRGSFPDERIGDRDAAAPGAGRQPGLETEMEPRPAFEPRYPGSGRLKGKVALDHRRRQRHRPRRRDSVRPRRRGCRHRLPRRDRRCARRRNASIEKEGRRCLSIAGDVGTRRSARGGRKGRRQLRPARGPRQQRGRTASARRDRRNRRGAASRARSGPTSSAISS